MKGPAVVSRLLYLVEAASFASWQVLRERRGDFDRLCPSCGKKPCVWPCVCVVVLWLDSFEWQVRSIAQQGEAVKP